MASESAMKENAPSATVAKRDDGKAAVHKPHPTHLLRGGHPLRWLRAEFDRGASCSDASFWHKTAEKVGAFFAIETACGYADTLGLPKYFPYNQYFADFLNALIHPNPAFTQSLVINAEYQTALILSTVVGGIGAVWSFKEKGWPKPRNLLNVLMAFPSLVTMDFTSAEITYYKENGHFTSVLPPADYTWRAGQFGSSVLGPIVNVINQPSVLFPGWILGYDIAVVCALAYVGLQAGISAYEHLTRKKVSSAIGYAENKVRKVLSRFTRVQETSVEGIAPKKLTVAGGVLASLGAAGVVAATAMHDGGAALASVIGMASGGSLLTSGILDIKRRKVAADEKV